MHRHSNVKRAWAPTVVRRNGAHTATTQARLEHLAAELDQFWQTDVVDTQGPAAFQDEDEGMPDITAEALTEAAAQVRATSVAAADGFHPKALRNGGACGPQGDLPPPVRCGSAGGVAAGFAFHDGGAHPQWPWEIRLPTHLRAAWADAGVGKDPHGGGENVACINDRP